MQHSHENSLGNESVGRVEPLELRLGSENDLPSQDCTDSRRSSLSSPDQRLVTSDVPSGEEEHSSVSSTPPLRPYTPSGSEMSDQPSQSHWQYIQLGDTEPTHQGRRHQAPLPIEGSRRSFTPFSSMFGALPELLVPPEVKDFNARRASRLQQDSSLHFLGKEACSVEQMKALDDEERSGAERWFGTSPRMAKRRIWDYERHTGQTNTRRRGETKLHAAREGPPGSGWTTLAVYTVTDDVVFLINFRGVPCSLSAWVRDAQPNEELAYSPKPATPAGSPPGPLLLEQPLRMRHLEQGQGLSDADTEIIPELHVSSGGFGGSVKWADKERWQYMDEMGSTDE